MRAKHLRELAHELGFADVGFCPIGSLEKERSLLQQWIARGYHASMGYMERGLGSPARLFPWARGFLVFVYRWDELHRETRPSWAPWVASFARGSDYHHLVANKLESLARRAGFLRYHIAVDATPLPERGLAARAGLGWIGKNRYLFHPDFGGDIGIAEIAVADEVEGMAQAEMLRGQCGDCRLCIEACPTGALTEYGVNSSLCLSYHTTESKSALPEELRAILGLRFLGCDSCLAACPFGKLSPPPRRKVDDTAFLHRVLALRSNRVFQRFAAESPFARLGRKAALRNAAVVAGNLESDELVRALRDVLVHDGSPLVREHASWALAKIKNGLRKHGLLGEGGSPAQYAGLPHSKGGK